MNLIVFEGRTVAVMAPEDLEALEAERDTLKRRVELVIKNRAEMEDCWNCPVYTGSETLTCETREKCEEHIAKWSLEQAKKGHP